MLGLQAAIGALNDLVDAPLDAGRKPAKPIPAGLVGRGTARWVVALSAGAGLALMAPSGPATVAVALAILGIGALYDLRLKGTAWSWLPFAIGIPLLPVYAWLGVRGSVPDVFLVLLPAGAMAGAALAIANALADEERDRAGGAGSVALALGARRAWLVHAGLLVAVVALAVGSVVAGGGGWPAAGVVALPGLVLGAGAALAASARADRRERGWELEAVGIAVLAGTWLVLAVPN